MKSSSGTGSEVMQRMSSHGGRHGHGAAASMFVIPATYWLMRQRGLQKL